jgi:hypothetical protein
MLARSGVSCVDGVDVLTFFAFFLFLFLRVVVVFGAFILFINTFVSFRRPDFINLKPTGMYVV